MSQKLALSLAPSAKSAVCEWEDGKVVEEYEWTLPVLPPWRKKVFVGKDESLPTPVFERGSLSHPAWKKNFKATLTDEAIHIHFVLPIPPTSSRWMSLKSFDLEFLDSKGCTLDYCALHLSPGIINSSSPSSSEFPPKSAIILLGGYKGVEIKEDVKALKFLMVLEGEVKGESLPAFIVEGQLYNDPLHRKSVDEEDDDEVGRKKKSWTSKSEEQEDGTKTLKQRGAEDKKKKGGCCRCIIT